MKIYLGSDHNGFDLRRQLRDYLVHGGYEVVDEGDMERRPDDDFPQFAARVANALLDDPDKESRGVLVCASGQGMCMAANRYKGIRASLCWSIEEAHAARNDDDSNVLCLPAKVIREGRAEVILHTFLSTPFAGAPRFVRRIKELDELG